MGELEEEVGIPQQPNVVRPDPQAVADKVTWAFDQAQVDLHDVVRREADLQVEVRQLRGQVSRLETWVDTLIRTNQELVQHV